MTRIALIIAFFGGGVASLFSLFASNDYFALIPFPELAIYLPALILGLPAMFTLRCFPTSIIVLACSALPFASLFHVAANDFERGLFICATIATTIPVACLIIKSGELRLCASAFVLGSLVNLGYIVAISGTGGFGRLGAAETVEHGAVSNANGFGGQMAVAAILAVTILLRDGKKTRDRSSSPSLSFLAVSTVGLLYLAVLLSGSRGAIISLSCASLVILFGGKMTIHRLMAMLMAVLLGGAAIVAEAGFLSTAFARFGDNSTLMTMGDRLPIWEAAIEAFRDNRWTGVGTGGVEQILAQYMVDLEGAHHDEFGISRKSCTQRLHRMVAVGRAPRSLSWGYFYCSKRAKRRFVLTGLNQSRCDEHCCCTVWYSASQSCCFENCIGFPLAAYYLQYSRVLLRTCLASRRILWC